MVRRALAIAAVVLAAVPAAASAHATLKDTVPARGAKLKAPPEFVELRFSESVETQFGAVQVLNVKGEQVQLGDAEHPGGKGSVVRVKLKPGLPDGGYTATYRVISADSHPVSSGFVFTVGDAPAGTFSVDDALQGTAAGPVTTTALGVMRGLQYFAIALGFGAFLFLGFAWMPALRSVAGAGAAWGKADEAFGARLRALLLAAGAVGVLSAVGGIILQGATASGTSFWASANLEVAGDVLKTRFGTVWGVGLLAWATVLVLAATQTRPIALLRPASVGATGLALPSGLPPRLVALALPLGALAALPALGGHASVQSPKALLLPTNVVHVACMAAWLGGIAVLVLALRSATAALEPGDRTRLLAASVGRFSTLAGAAVAGLAVTGVIQSIVYLSAFGQLLDTAFGRAVAIKSILFLVICGVGYVNRNRLLPQLRAAAASGSTPGKAGVALRKILRLELALGIAVIGVTGALAGYPPSTAESAGPFSTDTPIGPEARLETTVDPASTGLNEMHVYLFDRSSGAQWDKTKELTVRASLPSRKIAPVEFDAVKSGPGHYTISGATFGVAGKWTVEVTARVSDFDQYTTRIEVPIE